MILDKPIIFAVVGNSGSGKTTACEYASQKMGIPVLSSYTTRPKRAGEKEGKQHFFTTADKIPDRNQIIAYTRFGGHHYWATRSQVDGQGAILYVIDEAGLEELIERFEKIYYIVPIYIECTSDNPWIAGLDPKRLERDGQRRLLDKRVYRAIIVNDGTLDKFLTMFYKLLEALMSDPIANISDWCRNRCGFPTVKELEKQWKR